MLGAMTERIALDLPDGRVLDVQVSGPTDGIPLVWHHGTPGCSFQSAQKQRVAAEHGLRLVTPAECGSSATATTSLTATASACVRRRFPEWCSRNRPRRAGHTRR